MLARLRAHLTYANVISTLCLFLFLAGGTSLALNGSNSVSNDDVKDYHFKVLDLSGRSRSTMLFPRTRPVLK